MRSSIFFAAMMAAVATATPVLEIVTDITTVTEYVKPGQAPPTPAPVKPAPVAAKPAPAQQPASNGGSFEQNQPSKPSSSSSSGSTNSGNAMLDVANKWRQKYGLSTFTWDESLIQNCDETGQQGDGVQEIHKLIPDMAMGQVITPGQSTNVGDTQGMSAFEVAYVAWLCEVNTSPELQSSENDGVSCCDVVQNVLTMAYGGETGHQKILTDPQYTKIGCSFTPAHGQVDPTAKYQGLYVCDLAV